MSPRITTCLFASLFSLSTLNLFGQSGTAGNLASNNYQQAVIYLNSGKQIDCEILLFKKDTLHHSSKIKYRLGREKKSEKLLKIDSIKLGDVLYEKLTFKSGNRTYTKLITRVLKGESSLLISHWVNDSGYTFVTDKADYMTYDYYVQKNGKIVKIKRSGFSVLGKSVDEHGTIIRQLQKIHPDCSALEIDAKDRKITYDDIPELIELANSSCGS
ncbi:hypothetical protein [Ekhidna sp.]